MRWCIKLTSNIYYDIVDGAKEHEENRMLSSTKADHGNCSYDHWNPYYASLFAPEDDYCDMERSKCGDQIFCMVYYVIQGDDMLVLRVLYSVSDINARLHEGR